MTSKGKLIAAAVKAIGVTETAFYRWCSEYGGLKIDQVKRLKNGRWSGTWFTGSSGPR